MYLYVFVLQYKLSCVVPVFISVAILLIKTVNYIDNVYSIMLHETAKFK